MEFVNDTQPPKKSSGFVGSLVWAGIFTALAWVLAYLGEHNNSFFQPVSGWLASILMRGNAFANFAILWLGILLVFLLLRRLLRGKTS